MPWQGVTHFLQLICMGRLMLQQFWKLKNTATWKPSLKAPAPLKNVQEVGKYCFWSCTSRARAWSGQVALFHVQFISKSSLSTGFKLETLPPTNAYQAYHTVQQWPGNELSAKELGWHWQDKDGLFVPVETDNPVAPDNLLHLVPCGSACGCRKAGLYYVQPVPWWKLWRPSRSPKFALMGFQGTFDML